MTELHPFLAAVQAAYDAHGLPLDVRSVCLYHFVGCAPSWHISYGGPLGADKGNGPTAESAWRDLQAHLVCKDTMAQRRNAARELLAANGFDPSLVKDA